MSDNDPPTVFVRGGRLARVRCDERGRPQIETLTDASLRIEINDRISFRRLTNGADGPTSKVIPPR